ncbi:hypothetical protein T492DRAFT_160659 [Pavlovales sp. CCMP2436]|nr:hypothetical protein T492DRAFT_160659 [Pavlovales sp. CCMP2436]
MFVTYASVEVLLQFKGQHEAYRSVAEWPQPPIGLVVFDEAHTTAVSTKRGAKGEETLVAQLYARALDDIDLPCERRLFMTATPKMTRVDDYEGDAGSSRSCSMDAFELYGSRSSGTSVHGAQFSLPFDRAVALGLVVDYKIFAIGVDPKALPADCSRAAALRSLVADECIEFKLEGEKRCARVIELAKACCIERMILDHKGCKVLTFHRLIGADGASGGPAQTWQRKPGELFGAVGMCVLLKAVAIVPSLVESMRPLPQLELDGEKYSRILTLSSATSAAERDAVLRAFTAARDGRPVALTNPKSVATGFSATDIDTIVFVDPMASVVNTVQMKGRADRQDWPRTGDDLNVRSLRRRKLCRVVLPMFVADEVAKEASEMAAQMRAGGAGILQVRRSRRAAAEGADQTAAEPSSESAAQPVTESAAQSAAQPVTEPATEPAALPAAQPVTAESAAQPAAKPVTESAAKPAKGKRTSAPSVIAASRCVHNVLKSIAQSDTRLRYLLSTTANVVRVNGVLRRLQTDSELRALSEHFEVIGCVSDVRSMVTAIALEIVGPVRIEFKVKLDFFKDYVRDNEDMFLRDEIKQGHRITVEGKDVNFTAFISEEHSVPECDRPEFDELKMAAQWHIVRATCPPDPASPAAT